MALQKKKHINIYKEKFKFPLQLIITGRTRSGKSFLLRQRILPAIFKEYDGIFILSPTSNLDAGWNKFKKTLTKKQRKNLVFIDEFNEDQILELIRLIGDSKKEGGKEKYLFVCDDITDILTPSKRSFFSKMAIKGRHFNISYIITTHKYNSVNTLIRTNATKKIFFKINQKRELDTIKEENSTVDVTEEDIESMLNMCTGDYASLLIENGAHDDDYSCISKTGKIIPITL